MPADSIDEIVYLGRVYYVLHVLLELHVARVEKSTVKDQIEAMHLVFLNSNMGTTVGLTSESQLRTMKVQILPKWLAMVELHRSWSLMAKTMQ